MRPCEIRVKLQAQFYLRACQMADHYSNPGFRPSANEDRRPVLLEEQNEHTVCYASPYVEVMCAPQSKSERQVGFRCRTFISSHMLYFYHFQLLTVYIVPCECIKTAANCQGCLAYSFRSYASVEEDPFSVTNV
jgi:hypothetical protein